MAYVDDNRPMTAEEREYFLGLRKRFNDPALQAEYWRPTLEMMAQNPRALDREGEGYNDAAAYMAAGGNLTDWMRARGFGAQDQPETKTHTLPYSGGALNPAISYYGAGGQPYAGEDFSYWRHPSDNTWYQGARSGEITPYGPAAPWEAGAGGGGGVPPPATPPGGGIDPSRIATPGTRGDTAYGAGLPSRPPTGPGGDRYAQPPTPPAAQPAPPGASVPTGNVQDYPWVAGDRQQSGGGSLWDILQSYLGDGSGEGGAGGGGLPAGALSLAAMLESPKPRSWQTPGLGYGGGTPDRPSGRTTYFNQAGQQYRSGEDLQSYWYNPNDRAWFSGDLEGNVTRADQLPWMQLPWMQQNFRTPSGQGQDVAYFNEQGRPFGPGDQRSHWYNRNDQTWYQGDLEGNVNPIYNLPWQSRRNFP